MSEWISVKERLPEYGQPVLVARPGRAGEVKVEQGSRNVGGRWKVYGSLVKRATHWLPIPEPPKLPDEEEVDDANL